LLNAKFSHAYPKECEREKMMTAEKMSSEVGFILFRNECELRKSLLYNSSFKGVKWSSTNTVWGSKTSKDELGKMT